MNIAQVATPHRELVHFHSTISNNSSIMGLNLSHMVQLVTWPYLAPPLINPQSLLNIRVSMVIVRLRISNIELGPRVSQYQYIIQKGVVRIRIRFKGLRSHQVA